MLPILATVLLAIMALPALAADTAPAPAPVQDPVRVPPVSGVNNSRTPTEIQVTVPGQPAYTTTIPPLPASKKKLPVQGAGFPGCEAMKAPYRAGLWEITSVSNNSMMLQPITAKVKRCVTDRDARNACGLNQLSGGRNRDCQISAMQVSGNTASWSMKCDSPHFTGQGNGQSTFSDDAYQGRFDMTATMQGTPMQMNTTFTGKRLGNCK